MASEVFARISPAGYHLALRVGFAFPMEEHNEFPASWVTEYTRRGLVLMDPVMRWVYQNNGAIRWSEIPLDDPAGVLEAARTHGLVYGAAAVACDVDPGGYRSFGSFARSDREFTDAELAQLLDGMSELHRAKTPPDNITRAELEALSLVKEGLLMKEIAARLGVSEGAVQQRLKNAKAKLNANTSSQAVSIATGFGLI